MNNVDESKLHIAGIRDQAIKARNRGDMKTAVRISNIVNVINMNIINVDDSHSIFVDILTGNLDHAEYYLSRIEQNRERKERNRERKMHSQESSHQEKTA